MFTRQFIRVLALAAAAFPFGAVAAPLSSLVRPANGRTIADKYIVVFKNSADASAIAAHTNEISSFHADSSSRRPGSRHAGVERKYDMSHMKGYSGGFNLETLQEIAKSPLVSIHSSWSCSSRACKVCLDKS